MVKIVGYHNNCTDGFASFVLYKNLSGEECRGIPLDYGKKIPDDIDIFLDFCPDKVKEGQFVIDHHKTREQVVRDSGGIYDVNECGTSLVWKYFGSPECYSVGVSYVRDGDLFLNELPYHQEVKAYISSIPFDENYYLRTLCWTEDNFDVILSQGSAILRYRDSLINRIVKDTGQKGTFEGHSCLFVEAPKYLATNIPYDTEILHVRYGSEISLRSKTVDVAEIAQRFGGGGHKGAAGFRL